MKLNEEIIIELLGTVAFTISGAFSAMQKRLDVFGVLVIAFVTAIGGGTLRDVLIGYTPVTWMRNMNDALIILGTALAAIFFKKYIKNFKTTLFLFDALGLGLFTIIGMQKGLDAGLNPVVCVMLGTITGCFGGVLRDVLLNNIPTIFRRKELYATACIIGGMLYLSLMQFLDANIARLVAIICICGMRILAVVYGWKLPVR
ncbi:trimeric intracellular cation channel family protein [Mucilaginibacter aquatilis]|uniref:Trimeric intracellular cation channel family protein n=1 Tax=Mucilaginibacter aquatilis TaxID=1517760 RepID=A0A6I4I405_9SPHI|nr:trimeric intracellular cation channel family protein [Mucilaginibacter aquatilis]MVN89791.1 trimeric intracellular cation channel family protein [Mucilaginibacter aquatilis]